MIMSLFKNHCIKTVKLDQLDLLKTISPASWANIILNGFYDLTENKRHWDIESQITDLNIAA